MTAAVLAAVGVAVAACGEDEAAPGSGNEVAAPTTETSAAPEPSAAPEEVDAAPVGDVTKPGTELKIGDTATVPFEYSGKEGTIAVTVNKIEKGTSADLKDFGEKAKGMTPYFVRYTVENVGGTDLSRMSLKLHGVSAEGERTGAVTIGDIDKCESENAPGDFMQKGAKFETCALAVSGSSAMKVEAAQFAEGDAYETPDGKPVIWK